MKKTTHNQIILNILSDGKWHNVCDIIKYEFPDCVNVAVRSRISNLKSQGNEIESRINPDNKCADYRLKVKEQLELSF